MIVDSSRLPACWMAQVISRPASQPSWLLSIWSCAPRPAAFIPAMYAWSPEAVAFSCAEVPCWAFSSQFDMEPST